MSSDVEASYAFVSYPSIPLDPSSLRDGLKASTSDVLPNNLEYLEIWAPKIPSLATPNQKGEDSRRNDIYFNDSKLLESLGKEKRHDT